MSGETSFNKTLGPTFPNKTSWGFARGSLTISHIESLKFNGLRVINHWREPRMHIRRRARMLHSCWTNLFRYYFCGFNLQPKTNLNFKNGLKQRANQNNHQIIVFYATRDPSTLYLYEGSKEARVSIRSLDTNIVSIDFSVFFSSGAISSIIHIYTYDDVKWDYFQSIHHVKIITFFSSGGLGPTGAVASSFSSSSMTNCPCQNSSSSCFSTSGLKRLFFIMILRFNALGGGRGTPGSNWKKREKTQRYQTSALISELL